MANLFWLIVIVGGPILVAAAIVYALMKRRRLTDREKIAQHEAVDRIYHSENPEAETDRQGKRKELANEG